MREVCGYVIVCDDGDDGMLNIIQTLSKSDLRKFQGVEHKVDECSRHNNLPH